MSKTPDIQIQNRRNPFTIVAKDDWDVKDLQEQKLDHEKFHAIECQVLGVQPMQPVMTRNNQTGQQEPMMQVAFIVAIPVDPDKLTGGLITPDGLGSKFRKAIPIPAIAKVVINEEYLSDAYTPKQPIQNKPNDQPTPNVALNPIFNV